VKSSLKLTDELKGQSKYHKQITAEIKEHGDMLKALSLELRNFEPYDHEDVTRMYEKVNAALGLLTDEREVLRSIEGWSEIKWEMIIIAHKRRAALVELLGRVASWPPKPMAPYDELDALEKEMDLIMSKVEGFEKTRPGEQAKFAQQGIPFDWNLLKKIKLNTVRFGHRYCTIAVLAYEHHLSTGPPPVDDTPQPLPGRVRLCLENALQFSFRKVYQFAGGFDDAGSTKELFSRINKILMSAPAPTPTPATPRRSKKKAKETEKATEGATEGAGGVENSENVVEKAES